jgi:predicted dehydrogenase
MGTLNRRAFLKDSAFLAAAMAGAGALRAAEPDGAKEKTKEAGANDLLRVAIVGVNGRGMSHVGGDDPKRPGGFLNKQLNCVITTICDADEAVIGRAMKKVEDAQGKPPVYVQDIRKVVEDKNIDIITIATPNHWHALAAIWALQNGKHVYVEKPVSHNVSEGRRIVDAARRYNKICQTGTQSRSSTGMREAMEFLHNGKLGKISLARGLCYKPRGSIGKVDGEQPIPKSIDYDLWCGPAPKNPLMRKKLHYDWHWVWDYGNGDLGNQGIHEMDKARWGLNKNEMPKSVMSLGGRFGYVDDGQTANTQMCVYDYGDCELIFEVRGLKTEALKKVKVGNIYYGTEGYMEVPNYSSATAYTYSDEKIKSWGGGEDHFGNFIKAVRSRKVEDLNGDILEGHLSSALCHLGNISYRLGTDQPYDKAKGAFGDDKEAVETVMRTRLHLKDNMVADGVNFRVGLKLAIDPKAETFLDNKDANAMLTREYRKGFEVPAKI